MNETQLKLVLDAADEYAEQRARSGCRYYNKSTQAAFDKLKAALTAPPVLDKNPSEVATTDPKKNLGGPIIPHWGTSYLMATPTQPKPNFTSCSLRMNSYK